MKPEPFIELDRRFRQLDPAEDPEKAALDSYTASLLGRESGLGWKDLLDHRLVVVLGEPGSGKTWEFKEKVKKLQAEGKMAFFVPLEQLIIHSLSEILSPEENKKFSIWLCGDDRATFFLDSVDEAKYKTTSDFIAALDRFRNAIGGNGLMRMHLLLSSRISEWRPQSDVSQLIARFPKPPALKSKKQDSKADHSEGATEEQEGILIVQIEPLDRSRVERFTRERGIADPAAFIRALDESYAWPFAHRPIDVVGLLNYWNTDHKLGSLTELIEYDLNQKLKETADREKQYPLTPEKARLGAETLGAAVAFCRIFSFRVPDDAYLVEDAAIDSSACLPEDWCAEDRQALLSRALFDSASYGRIRFHHQRSAEYLTAQWLTSRMKEGCTTPLLEDLLFDRIGNRDIIRPSLAPVTEWLCGGKERWNDDIRHCVLKSAPKMHLRYGDPGQLPLEYKKRLLNALVERYEGRERAWIDSDHESLSRLADPALADDIAGIVRNRQVSADVRIELLLLVRYGRLTDCLDAVLDLIADAEELDDLKHYAVAALRDAGEIPHLLRLWKIVQSWTLIQTGLCALLCEALFPKVIDAEGLVALLRKSEKVVQYAHLPHQLRRHFEEVVIPEISGTLLAHLTDLCRQPRHTKSDGEVTPISAHFNWIGEVLPPILKILLEKSCLTDSESDTAAHALWLLGRLKYDRHLHEHDLKDDLDALTHCHPEVRRRYFWYLIDERKAKNKEAPSHPLTLFDHFNILKGTPADLDWSIDDIISRKEEADQCIALRMAIDIWNMRGRKWRDRQRIRRVLADNAALLNQFKTLAEYGPKRWIKHLWDRYYKYRFAEKWWWERRIDPIRQGYQWLSDQWYLLRHIRVLKSGKAAILLSNLAREADEDSHSQWAPRSWNKLVEKHGRLITWAAKEGCKQSWRQFIPELPHEKPNPQQTNPYVIVGLAGLQAAFTDNQLDFARLSAEDARLAARYAVNELNGFAPWLPELARHQPSAVQDVLSECIRGEWQFDSKREHADGVLSDLIWHGEGLIHLVKDVLLAQLRSGDPPNDSILEKTLTLLLHHPDSPTLILAEMAADRAQKYQPANYKFILWLAVWLQLDAEPALKFMQEILLKTADANQVMVRLCSVCHYDSRLRLPTVPSPNYAAPTHLRTFIPLVYRYVRPVDDIDRVGTGGYSPTPRDRAQEFRGSLLTLLSQAESKEADPVLREFLEEPMIAHLHDYILHLLDQRIEHQADRPPWNPKGIRTFAKEHEADPKTDRDLFKIACWRLQDIKHDVEKADKSIRYEVHQQDDEPKLRIWLARKLQEPSRSRNRYTVPQEEEIDRRKRPDLRIVRPGIAPISIEIKWADKLPLQELLEGLENQLVGQYLRDANSHYGIYLLGYIGRQQFWKDPINKSRYSFDKVVSIIDERAQAIVAERRDIEDIAVISIDFTEPL